MLDSLEADPSHDGQQRRSPQKEAQIKASKQSQRATIAQMCLDYNEDARGHPKPLILAYIQGSSPPVRV